MFPTLKNVDNLLFSVIYQIRLISLGFGLTKTRQFNASHLTFKNYNGHFWNKRYINLSRKTMSRSTNRENECSMQPYFK